VHIQHYWLTHCTFFVFGDCDHPIVGRLDAHIGPCVHFLLDKGPRVHSHTNCGPIRVSLNPAWSASYPEQCFSLTNSFRFIQIHLEFLQAKRACGFKHVILHSRPSWVEIIKQIRFIWWLSLILESNHLCCVSRYLSTYLKTQGLYRNGFILDTNLYISTWIWIYLLLIEYKNM